MAIIHLDRAGLLKHIYGKNNKLHILEHKFLDLEKRNNKLITDSGKSIEELVKICDRSTEQLNKQLAEKDESIANLEKQLAEKDESIVNLEKQLAEKDKSIANLEEQLAEKTEQLNEIKEILTNL